MPDVEQQIKEAMARGDFDNLPNKGKPLDLSSNPFENPDMRLAYKILKDQGYAPTWIELEKEIKGDLERAEKIQGFLQQRRQRLSELIEEAPRRRQPIAKTFELERQRSLDSFCKCLVEVNKKIDKFNLIVPILDRQFRRISIDMEVERFRKESPSL